MNLFTTGAGLLVGSLLIISSISAASVDKDEFCSTPLCNQIADNLDKSLNRSVNPCDDFYEYSCGGWKANHKIPETSSVFQQMAIMFLRLKELLSDSLEESKTNNKTQAKIVNYTRYLFEECIHSANYTAIPKKDFVKELAAKYIEEVVDYWNIIHNITVPWHEFYVNSLVFGGINPWFDISIQPDPKNVTTNIITFDSVSFMIGDNELQNMDKNRQEIDAYKVFIEKISIDDGDLNNTLLRKEVDAIVQLDSDLAKVKLSPEKQRDPKVVYNKMTLKQMSEVTQFDWLENIVSPLLKALKITDYNLSNKTEVLVTDVRYMTEAVKILNKLESDTYYLYGMTKLIMDYAQYESDSIRKFAFEFAQVQIGVKKQEELPKICLNLVYGDFPMALSRVFVDSYFPDSDKKSAEVIIKEVHQAYQQLITENKWLDEDTRKKSLDKLRKVHINVAYPEWMKNDDELDKYHGLEDKKFYQQLVDEENFMYGLAQYRSNLVRNMFEQLFKQTSIDYRWPMEPAVVDAAYEPTQNSITIPAGFLTIPFFNAEQPSSMNFGAIGIVIGHEFTHGLDDEGRQFDANGSLHDWWSKEAVERFQNRSECFVKQYGSQHVKEVNLNINGKLTLGENIADNGGVHEAYRAYRNAQAKSPSKRLAKLSEFNSDQLFFLSFGQTWCGLIRPEALRRQIEYDPHSPMKYRTNVPFTNSPDFANAFKCPVGSPMNPKEKCLLW